MPDIAGVSLSVGLAPACPSREYRSDRHRGSCLDHVIVLNERHLRSLLDNYFAIAGVATAPSRWTVRRLGLFKGPEHGLPVDRPAPAHRLLSLARLRHRRSLPHPLRQVRPRQDPPRRRHRLPRHLRTASKPSTTAALIDELSAASRQGRMREALADYLHP